MAPITYTVTGDVTDMGWSPEALADALRAPLAALGVEVICKPRQSGGGGLVNASDASYVEAEVLRETVTQIVERIVSA